MQRKAKCGDGVPGLSLTGAVVLSLSIDSVQQSWLPLPATALSVLRWHWP